MTDRSFCQRFPRRNLFRFFGKRRKLPLRLHIRDMDVQTIA
ncbi:hypothetical protein RBSH_04861 [Rhodopirellula baltica SH28]|uniref:Uncharacterized protein n=1 Tax=Rhodopirellula baltica SH28 TaxID=993517 RepID=K5DBH0_RHOBT|nr:hypothetical protein RBSH_04861 [Rhodopirellula baltica SH28]